MSRLTSDLVRDSRLETLLPAADGVVEPGTVVHLFHVPDPRRRRLRIQEGWRREGELGSGSFGRVWLERCYGGPRIGALRAVKEMRKDEPGNAAVDYSRELEAMAKFSQKKYVHCFVESYGWFESPEAVFIAMEYVSHGDLQKHLACPFPESQAQDIASQLVEGLEYMHDNGFAHRDLKPANILVWRPGPDWWVKIGDFGITKRAEDQTALRTRMGTDHYTAPEVKGIFTPSKTGRSSGSYVDEPYTLAVDVWALGEIIHRLITNRPVFSKRTLFEYVVNGHEFPTAELAKYGVSPECFGFVAGAMAASPDDRPTIRQAKAHRWLGLPPDSPRLSGSQSAFVTPEVSTPAAAIPQHGNLVPQHPPLKTSVSAYFDNARHSHGLTATASWTDLSVGQDDLTARVPNSDYFRTSGDVPQPMPFVQSWTADYVPKRDQGFLGGGAYPSPPLSDAGIQAATENYPSIQTGLGIPPDPSYGPRSPVAENTALRVGAGSADGLPSPAIKDEILAGTARWSTQVIPNQANLIILDHDRRAPQALLKPLRLPRMDKLAWIVVAVVVLRRSAARRARRLRNLRPSGAPSRSVSSATRLAITGVESAERSMLLRDWASGWKYRAEHWGVASAEARNARIVNAPGLSSMHLESINNGERVRYTLQSDVYLPSGLAGQSASTGGGGRAICKVARSKLRVLLYREARMLLSLDHARFPKIVDMVVGSSDPSVGALVFNDLSQFVNLERYLEERKRPSPSVTLEIFAQLLAGIDFLARPHHAAHTQLTPASVLVAEETSWSGRTIVRVSIINLEGWEGLKTARNEATITLEELEADRGDFERSNHWVSQEWSYLPPEKLLFSPPKPATRGTDLWSLGMILLRMHQDDRIGPGPGHGAFNPTLGRQFYVHHVSITLPMELDRFIHATHGASHPLQPWKDILQGVLRVLPHERIASDDIWRLLMSHPNITDLHDATTQAHLLRRTGPGTMLGNAKDISALRPRALGVVRPSDGLVAGASPVRETAARSSRGLGPATFEEMGIAERSDGDCVVM